MSISATAIAGPPPQGPTLFQRLAESSHPIALLFFLGFRFGKCLLLHYSLVSTLTDHFLRISPRLPLWPPLHRQLHPEFITVILLLAADFWNVKNISGRLLVGLRWWNETDDNGDSIWVFETANPDRVVNPIDSKVFWVILYASPAFWVILGILALLKFEFLSLSLVIIAIALTMTNAMAFTRCDKFGKANDLASNVFGTVSGGLLSRISPFALFGRS